MPLFFLGIGALFTGFLFKEIFIGHHSMDFWQTSIFFIDENFNAYDFKRDIYDSDIGGVFRHIGFYGFDRDTLLQFSLLPASKNEIKYSLEQFRALDNGIKIKAFISNAQQQAVDSPEDLDRVLSQLNKIKDPD